MAGGVQDSSSYGYSGQGQGGYSGYGAYSGSSQYGAQYGASGLNGQGSAFK